MAADFVTVNRKRTRSRFSFREIRPARNGIQATAIPGCRGTESTADRLGHSRCARIKNGYKVAKEKLL
jgi:hypothetical protein